jgi:phospholipase/carboxylesterase
MNRLTRSGDTVRSSITPQALQESLQPDLVRFEARATSYFLPSRYEPNYRYPLVVWLHADGGCQRELADVMPHISTQNYVGVGIRATRACDSAGHRFQWLQTPLGTAVAEDAVFAAIDSASRKYSVNPNRIYLAGYREGGTMALRIALRNANEIDGAISLDGALPRGGRPLTDLESARKLAILSAVAIDGDRYPMNKVCEDLRMWHTANLRMDMRQYTVEDCMVTEVLADVNAWIMRRVTGQTNQGCVPDNETVPVEFSAN